MIALSPTLVIVLKLLMAMLCGGAIGLERELSHKPAGLRTNVLICVGASLFTVVSRHIGGGAPYTDPARLVAQVITAIGFVGAGVILQSRGSISGLTTAATILVVGAVGITVGDGMFTIALIATLLIIFVLVLLRRVEHAFVRKRRLFHYSMKTANPGSSLPRLFELIEKEGMRLGDFSLRDLGEGSHEINFAVITSFEGNNRLVQRLPEIGRDLKSSTVGTD